MTARSLPEEVARRLQGAAPTEPAVAAILRDMALPGVGEGHVAQVMAALAGAAGLQEWVDLPGVTDVLVANSRIWIDRGDGLEDAGEVPQPREAAIRLAALGGRRLDDAHPIVDAQLPSGVRLHAVLPPISADGVLISVRVPRPGGFSLAELQTAGMFDETVGKLLRQLVAGGVNIVVSGATGSGKTTLLAALLALVPSSERIVCVEETAELTPDHPHVVHVQSREANVEGAGAVTMPDLVRASLRMRPDWLVVGECRGGEVRDMLLALNTGHRGAATIHANSAADVPARLIALASLAGISADSARLLARSAFDVVVHVVRSGRRRFVEQIALLSGPSDEVVPIIRRAVGSYEPGPGWDAL